MAQQLDNNNPVFFQAADFILNGMDDQTDIVLLTGKAGTGKTTLLKYIIDNYEGKAVVLAPTGVAAINAGGQTIHSFFQMRPPFFYPPGCPELYSPAIYNHLSIDNDKKRLLNKIDLMIIDEVSMVRCELLDAVDRILSVYRHNSSPFGGVKVLLIGDVFQLPPVNPPNGWAILHNNYDSCHFFNSYVYRKSRVAYFELEKVYRQDESEIDFMHALNHIRMGEVNEFDIQLLNTRVFTPPQDESCIRLMTTNAAVDTYNDNKYNNINSVEIIFHGIVCGTFDVSTMSRVDEEIRLKVGAQIMTVCNCYDNNDNFIFYNGSIGTVTAIDNNARWVEVKLAETGQTIIVEPYRWENIVREYDEENDKIVNKVIGSFEQIPIRLAWAVTIHKSQGLSFDKAVIDLQQVFAPGQAYVALSRCRRLSGMYLQQEFSEGVAFTDPIVMIFYKEMEEVIRKIIAELNRADNLYQEAWNSFKAGDAVSTMENFRRAKVITNYMTHGLHRRCARIANIIVRRHWSYKSMADSISNLEYDINYCKEELEKLGNTFDDLDRENTELLSENETLRRCLNELEHDNSNMMHDIAQKDQDISKQSVELQSLKQLFIDKTIELDRLKKDPWYKRLFKIGW